MNTPEVALPAPSIVIPVLRRSVLLRHVATTVRNGRYLHCPDGSHMAMYNDQERYVGGLIDFIHAADAGRFAE